MDLGPSEMACWMPLGGYGRQDHDANVCCWGCAYVRCAAKRRDAAREGRQNMASARE